MAQTPLPNGPNTVTHSGENCPPYMSLARPLWPYGPNTGPCGPVAWGARPGPSGVADQDGDGAVLYFGAPTVTRVAAFARLRPGNGD